MRSSVENGRRVLSLFDNKLRKNVPTAFKDLPEGSRRHPSSIYFTAANPAAAAAATATTNNEEDDIQNDFIHPLMSEGPARLHGHRMPITATPVIQPFFETEQQIPMHNPDDFTTPLTATATAGPGATDGHAQHQIQTSGTGLGPLARNFDLAPVENHDDTDQAGGKWLVFSNRPPAPYLTEDELMEVYSSSPRNLSDEKLLLNEIKEGAKTLSQVVKREKARSLFGAKHDGDEYEFVPVLFADLPDGDEAHPTRVVYGEHVKICML